MQSQSTPRRRGPRPVHILLGLVALGAVAIGVEHFLPRPEPAPAAQVANPYTVWRICQERVSAELKAPASAQFPGYDERGVAHSGRSWTVRSHVDSQNSFGAMLRTPYTCDASFDGSTYSVEGVKVG